MVRFFNTLSIPLFPLEFFLEVVVFKMISSKNFLCTGEENLMENGGITKSYCVKNLFDRYIDSDSIFVNRDLLSSNYIPNYLPHREKEISDIVFPLSLALKDSLPSNIVIYGKPGCGKTASTKIVGKELRNKAFEINKKISFVYVNCHTARSVISIFKAISNEIFTFDKIGFNGRSLDYVYSKFLSFLDKKHMNLVVCLDEVDKLGDEKVLYLLSRINCDLKVSKVSIVLISNDIGFIKSLDERIKSSLSLENIVFPPYNAGELQDILYQRAENALKKDCIDSDVIPLCSALAAQEHGDARRALDLLRVSSDLAERSGSEMVTKRFVKLAKNKIEFDQIVEVVRSLPMQSKIVLYAIILRIENKDRSGISGGVNTGEVYSYYKKLTSKSGFNILSQRSIADIVSSLDSIGVINAPVVSKGRDGRSRRINISFDETVIKNALVKDESLEEIFNVRIKNQARLI